MSPKPRPVLKLDNDQFARLLCCLSGPPEAPAPVYWHKCDDRTRLYTIRLDENQMQVITPMRPGDHVLVLDLPTYRRNAECEGCTLDPAEPLLVHTPGGGSLLPKPPVTAHAVE